ncbi:hypothetical protein JRQ81_005167 [Phrynocephalus forsythii]|uniref:1-acyl-sn-glycerol-3-phosphate acyltransferase n=1 Tax=Phrynocephalus forsythii TaxID=171643 RepID=A0A9Q1AV15_9SAUR|nr:hypothetical protein JRQ81_005167 [Phrynocephalus forsythii]
MGVTTVLLLSTLCSPLTNTIKQLRHLPSPAGIPNGKWLGKCKGGSCTEKLTEGGIVSSALQSCSFWGIFTTYLPKHPWLLPLLYCRDHHARLPVSKCPVKKGRWLLSFSPVVNTEFSRVKHLKVLCFCIKPLKYIFGIKITVQGSENLNIQGPYVIVSNHQSCIDLLGMVEVIPDGCVTIAKKELLYLGPIGWAVWLCGLICIDRKKKLEAIATMERIAQTMRQDDMKVWIYPEGTRNEGDTMLPFKRGAFHLALKAQVPLVPIVTSSLKGTYSYKEKRFNPGHWTIRILPKIETKRLRVEDAMELAESTRNLMQDTFYEISRDVCGEKDPRQQESCSPGSL